MAKDNILNYYVPQEVLFLIMSKYLELEDVSRFDIAICNKTRRHLYLEECIGKLFSSRGCKCVCAFDMSSYFIDLISLALPSSSIPPCCHFIFFIFIIFVLYRL